MPSTLAPDSLESHRPLPAASRAALTLVLLGFLATGCEVLWDDTPDPTISRWSPDSGWQVLLPGDPSPGAQALREDARAAFEAGKTLDALRGLEEIEKNYPDSLEAREPATTFLIAECHYELNNYERANEYYQKTIARRPPREILSRSLNQIYNIGLAFLHGTALRTFAGVEYRSPALGVDILIGEGGLVTRYPFLDFSDNALWEVADYYYKKEEYDEAEQVLERLVEDYAGKSEWGEAAEYLLALCVFRQIRGEDYDQRPIEKAKRKFNQYRHHYPRGSKIPEVRQHLQEISEMEARYDLKIAKYYLRESRPTAATYYLQSVILNYPKTEAYSEAREIYQEMERLRKERESRKAVEASS